ncbi:MAG TPA: undecaprenyl-diphosphate phosphatase [Patescibacteria group bacterium]|nr:undecaprenyl-diphosphate phosphatase [Patescibacteria group bacterium]
MSFLQAIIIGIVQGITELFPISSLGHSVLLPALLGWHNIVGNEAAKESSFLAFLVGLHCATAIALIIFYREKWVAIIRGFFRTLGTHKVKTSDERLAWLLVVATIPAALMGLLFEHKFRTIFAKPLLAAIFLTINGVILLIGEYYRRQVKRKGATRKLAHLGYREAGVVGIAQILALFAGISRSGITMVAGLIRGLDHEDSANFAFLLATPIILGAGLYKLPDLLGPNGDGIRAQVLVGSLAAGLTAYFSVRFLTKYFETRTLTPFAIYSLVVGGLMIIRFM